VCENPTGILVSWQDAGVAIDAIGKIDNVMFLNPNVRFDDRPYTNFGNVEQEPLDEIVLRSRINSGPFSEKRGYWQLTRLWCVLQCSLLTAWL
jgi:hypothetical protein